MPGDPEMIAQQNGWSSKGYGWYQDSSGQVVARNIGGTMYQYDSPPSEADTQVDQGNPTPAGGAMKPADRARSMGLQSNGKGGYIDPKTGQVAARTVNNELVFYDGGPGGGAVSDGAGGQNIATAQPSWQDPETGLIVVPPAKPETPQELAAIPDPVPAQSPQSFNSFIQQKKLQTYQQNHEQNTIKQAEEEALAQYQSVPIANEFYQSMQPVFDKASESGDEARSAVAEYARGDLLENPDEYVTPFQIYAREYDDGEDLTKAVKAKLIGNARKKYYEQNIVMPIMQDESLSDEEKQDQIELANSDPDTGPESYEKLLNYSEQIFGMYEDMQKDDEMEAERDDEEVYEGEYVRYTVKSDTFGDDALNVADEMGLDPNGEVREVLWGADDSAKEDSDSKRKAAFDALKVWRQQVLPDLEPGTVVTNYPDKGGRGGQQRARMYQMAGFGNVTVSDDGEVEMQAGIVVDENGQRRVIPLGDTDPASRLRESIVNMIVGTELSEEQLDEYYEVLFT